nr:sensor histidine kinase [uncultured Mucilaginibacter sp.]
MKRLLLLLLLAPAMCCAQSVVQVDSLIALARKTMFNDYNKAIQLSASIIKQSHALNDPIREVTGLNLGGIARMMKGKLDSAMIYYEKAHTLAKKTNDLTSIAKVSANIGICYFRMARYDKALEYGLEGLSIHEKQNDTLAMARNMADIANIFITLHQPAKAIDYLKKAASMITKKGDRAALGNFYNSMGVAYTDLDKPALAAENYEKALANFKEFNNKKGQLSSIVNLSDLNIILKKPDNLNDLLVAEKIAKELEDDQRLSNIYLCMARVYRDKKEYPKALDYASLSVKYSRDTKEIDNLTRALHLQSELYYRTGQGDKALDLQDELLNLKDSIYDAKSIKQMQEMQVKYQTEKKQRQIELLSKQSTIQKLELNNQNLVLGHNKLELNNRGLLIKNKDLSLRRAHDQLQAKQLEARTRSQQIVLLNKENTIQKLSINSRNTTIGIIAGLFLLSGIFGGLFYNRNQLKQKALLQTQMLKQQDVLSKAVIDAEEKERQRIAGDLHDGVGQLFSAVKMNLNGIFERVPLARDEDRFLVEKTLALVDESCKEVRSISHQMMPNMLLRSGIASDVKSFIEKIDAESLRVTLDAKGFTDKLESNVEVVLYRVIQETVNNVIKHAKADRLEIKLTRNDTGITAIIADNGIGFNTALKGDFEGIGLKNIATRIEYLKGTVYYTSAKNKGTTVKVWVPVA